MWALGWHSVSMAWSWGWEGWSVPRQEQGPGCLQYVQVCEGRSLGESHSWDMIVSISCLQWTLHWATQRWSLVAPSRTRPVENGTANTEAMTGEHGGCVCVRAPSCGLDARISTLGYWRSGEYAWSWNQRTWIVRNWSAESQKGGVRQHGEQLQGVLPLMDMKKKKCSCKMCVKSVYPSLSIPFFTEFLKCPSW